VDRVEGDQVTIRQLSGDFDYDVVFTVDMTKAMHDKLEADIEENGEYTFPSEIVVEKNGFGPTEGNPKLPYTVSNAHSRIYEEICDILFEWQNLCFNNDLLMKKVKVTIKVEEVK
jgi:hypothetical protein